MILKHKDSRFEIKTTYEEYQKHGTTIKMAGFRWDPAAKVWWTDKPDNASLLISVADEETGKMLISLAESREEALAASRAEDADVSDIIHDLGVEPYPFQRAGIAYAQTRDRVLFGDEPGLGKTLQSLATVHGKWAYPCVVIAPASLKINWMKEAMRCVPELREDQAVRIIIGNCKDGATLIEGSNDPGAMLWIINYNILGSWVPQLRDLELKSVIVDECHFFKNPNAARTKAGFDLIAGEARDGRKKISTGPGIPQRYFLSGTALENRPKELVPQLEMLGVIDKFGGSWNFLKRFCDGKQESIWTKGGKKLVWNFDGESNLSELQRLLRQHVMVRRLKDDVLTELPPKRHQAIEISNPKLLAEENELYSDYEDRVGYLEARMLAAEALKDQATFEEAAADLEKAHKVFFNECAELSHKAAVAKIPKAIEFCLEALEGMEKLVVFAHHHDVVFALEAAFKKAGIECVRHTGMDSDKVKNAAVEAFQNGSARVFIGSLSSAGVGLTLTRGSMAVMVEFDWRPGMMDQAADRLHRIGQRDSVLIVYLVLENSIDGKKVGMLIKKRRVMKDTLDTQHVTPDLPKGEPIKRKQHEYSDEERQNVLLAMRMLAGMCDGARERDSAGFNKIDTYFGKAMAGLGDLTDKQTQACKSVLKKYHRQIPDELFNTIFPGGLTGDKVEHAA